MGDFKTKQVIRIGNSFGVALSRELDRIGVDRERVKDKDVKENIFLKEGNGVILLAKNAENLESVVSIDDGLWDRFTDTVDDELDKEPKEAVKDIIEEWTERMSSFWDKPLLK